jgi:halimadienyl-diphosphate synthase
VGISRLRCRWLLSPGADSCYDSSKQGEQSMGFRDLLFQELDTLIGSLGKDGGLVSPSIYDTAQVLRFTPANESAMAVLAWLENQQWSDGGWGDPWAPLSRDVPTLAAILTLHSCQDARKDTAEIVEAGLTFLRQSAGQWQELRHEEMPVAVELILPALLDEAAGCGLELPREPYAALREVGARRHAMLAQRPFQSGTPPLHSWEVWGTAATTGLLDGSGGVGHSPAATAAWLRTTCRRPDPEAHAAARRYLRDAAHATGCGVPGIVPTVWPITRFEQSFVLHVLCVVGLLDHPALAGAIGPQLDKLSQALQPDGLGMSDFFMADGDDTAAAVAVLQAAGHKTSFTPLRRFQDGNHFKAYRGELQPSLSLTARAAHTLALFGEEKEQIHKFITDRQLADGRWPGDKWNSSWLYTTYFAILALTATARFSCLHSVVEALLCRQRADGGWGENGRSTSVETAFGALTLHTLSSRLNGRESAGSLRRAYAWLRDNYAANSAAAAPKCWLGKELYRPARIDRAIELSTLIVLSTQEHLREEA